ncbi:hypothetical protein EDB86DRAFT_3083250 [Lactarius hatsudake]|nr:hypothetical protein EDB86DRAFT_3083250 [Lactarius hatsudake]
MSGDNVDTYIATFEWLALVAGWHQDTSRTVEFFHKGLTRDILPTCLLRTTMPKMIDEWQAAACAEMQRAHTMASCLPPRKDGLQKLIPSFYSHTILEPMSWQIASDSIVLMDIDAITTTTPQRNPRYTSLMSDVDRERCWREGHCFSCQQPGHLAIQCPQKPCQPSARLPSVHANTITTTSQAAIPVTQPINMPTVMSHLLNLSGQDRQTVINNLLLMRMGGSDLGADDAPQINVIGLNFTPFNTESPLSAVLNLDTTPATTDSVPIPPPFIASLVSLPAVPPPRPLRSPHRLCSPKIAPPPLPVVKDNKSPKGGVKTSPSASVFDLVSPINEPPHQPLLTTPRKLILPAPVKDKSLPQMPPPRPPRSLLRAYKPIFLINALK